MAWSKWRGALVLMLLASVGLAWSQTPMFNRSASSAPERIMTVHENGKAQRCRVVQSWKTSTGAQAHQLQVIDTGELLTIVEDGSPTTVPTTVAGTQTRAMPMRIFHWGQRNRVSPAGAPLPPETSEPVAMQGAETVIQTSATQNATTIPTTSGTTAGNANCPDKVVAWEAGTGKPVLLRGSGPVIQTSQSEPVIIEGGQPTIVSAPAGQVIQRTGGMPRFPSKSHGPVVISEKVISSSPVTTVQGNATQLSNNPVTNAHATGAQTKNNVTTVSGVAGQDPVATLPITKTMQSSVITESNVKAPTTMREKIGNIFQKPVVAKPADPKPVETKNVTMPTEIPSQIGKTADKKGVTNAAATTKSDDKKPTTLPVANKGPFSTATAQSQPTPKASPLGIPGVKEGATKDEGAAAARNDLKDLVIPETPIGASKKKPFDWRDMWGKEPEGKIVQPGQATIDREKMRKELPPASTLPLASTTERKKQDILMAPEKFNPGNEKMLQQVPAELAAVPTYQPMGSVPTPLGVQSVLSARNGAQGPVQYIPVPVATVPEPLRPPTPPAPRLPEPPNPTAYVNAFSAPPNPQAQQFTPEQMQLFMQHQAMMQQQAYLQQLAMQQRMQQAQTAQLVPVGYGAPLQVSYPATYAGPQAPNPVAQQPIQQAQFVQPAVGFNPAMDRRVVQASAQQLAASDSNTLANLVRVLQESPYPAQREWAATNLSTFDWRVHPHLTQVLVQTARQDSVASVRAAAIYSLSRMNVQSEPVLGTLHALRGDADPRVRQEVEQAYIRMGLTPTQP